MSRASWQHQPVYSLLTWCLAPIVFAHLVWRSLHDGGWLYFKQRLGFAIPKLGTTDTVSPLAGNDEPSGAIWVHAASVGEVNTAAPLINAIHAENPNRKIVITTNTPTGKQAIDRQGFGFAQSTYLPLDYSFAIKRFIYNNSIHCGIIIETEIWPTLLEHCTFPVIIANGRLSSRTLRVVNGQFLGRILAKIYRRAVSHIDLVLARNQADATGFVRLGVPDNRIETVGNLKFAGLNIAASNFTGPRFTASGTEPGTAPKTANTKAHNADKQAPFGRPFCLLASTHDNEELQLASEWVTRQRDELLVISPRHPDRRATLIKQLETVTHALCVRSRADQVDAQCQIYLADTLGEMSLWYQHAAAIFMGGSLVPNGGHNFIEPALYGQSVITGPHTENFKDELDTFNSANAIVQVNSCADVIGALIELVESPTLAIERGMRAHSVIKANDQIEKRYLAALDELLDSPI